MNEAEILSHFERLEQMYRTGPIHDHFPEFKFKLDVGKCEIISSVNPTYHHAAGAMHGLVYFKYLDDSGYFAAQSLETEYFLLTKSATVELLKPVIEGELIARGYCNSTKGKVYHAVSELWKDEVLVAKSELVLVKSKILLGQELGYS